RKLQVVILGSLRPSLSLNNSERERRVFQICSDLVQRALGSEPGAVRLFKQHFSIERELPQRGAIGKLPDGMPGELGGVEISSLFEEPLDERIALERVHVFF